MLKFFRIHTVPSAHEESLTWLDLFFDLVYVAILIELGNRLSHDLSLQGVFEFAFIFIPIWWSWLALVSYNKFFPTDDIGQRLLTIAYMAVMVVLAFEIHSLTVETATTFLLTYAVVKFFLVAMYARAWAHYPEYRGLTSHYVFIYAVAGVLWTLIAFIAPTNFWLWAVAIAVTVLAPGIIHVLRRARGKAPPRHPPAKHHYMLHRFGELTIIVLGEFFIKIVTSSSDRELVRFNAFLGACLLGISVSMWWLYFDHLGHASLAAAKTRIDAWVYTHYPLLAAITAYGVVGTKVFAAAPGEALAAEKRLLLCLALAVAVLALGVIEWASPEKKGPMARRPQLWIRTISAIVLGGLALWGGQLGVGLLVALVALVFLVQVGLDIYARLRASGSESSQNIVQEVGGHV
jgi:low temperature requirement protein LtrA